LFGSSKAALRLAECIPELREAVGHEVTILVVIILVIKLAVLDNRLKISTTVEGFCLYHQLYYLFRLLSFPFSPPELILSGTSGVLTPLFVLAVTVRMAGARRGYSHAFDIQELKYIAKFNMFLAAVKIATSRHRSRGGY
jgi:hypothetical protein